jgi:hypothetical protein
MPQQMLHVRELQIPYTYSLTRFVPDMPPTAVKVIFADGVYTIRILTY